MTGANPHLDRRRAGRSRKLDAPVRELLHQPRRVFANRGGVDSRDRALRGRTACHHHRAGQPCRAILHQPGPRVPVEMSKQPSEVPLAGHAVT